MILMMRARKSLQSIKCVNNLQQKSGGSSFISKIAMVMTSLLFCI